MLRVHVAYVQGKGSDWLPPTLAAIISKRKKVAGAAATTRHATNSLYGDGGIMWKLRGCVSVEPKEPLHTDGGLGEPEKC